MHGSLSDIDQHALHVNDTVYIYWTLKNAKNLSVKENSFCIHIIITRMHGPARSICLPMDQVYTRGNKQSGASLYKMRIVICPSVYVMQVGCAWMSEPISNSFDAWTHCTQLTAKRCA